MQVKLLAIDLDDTLLNEVFRVSDRNRKALRQAMDKGVLVTLATGRMHRSAVPFALELGIELPLITYHGALVKKASETEAVYHCPVPLPLARELAGILADRGYHVNAYVQDKLYVAEENELTRYYQQIASVDVTAVGDLAAFLQESPTKLTIIDRNGVLDPLRKEIKTLYGEQLSVAISRPHFLEVTDKMATKGRALSFLAKKHGIPKEQVAAIGDSYNDIDMLEYAGISVAVANAREEVKAVADIITGANVDDGVAGFVNKYIIGGEEEK